MKHKFVYKDYYADDSIDIEVNQTADSLKSVANLDFNSIFIYKTLYLVKFSEKKSLNMGLFTNGVQV